MVETTIIDNRGRVTVSQSDPLDDARIMESMMDALPFLFTANEMEHNRKVIDDIRAKVPH